MKSPETEEEIGQLADLAVEVERVIDEDSTRTFQCRATVLLLDDQIPGDLYAGADVRCLNPVPVTNSEGTTIGWATLTIEGHAVEAQFFLDYHTPERLSIETRSPPMYPHILADEAMDNSSGAWRVAGTTIREVQLLSDKPADDRISAL